MLGRARAVGGARRQDVLAAGRRRIVIVDDQHHAVALVEDGVADAGCQAIVPKAAVAHHRDRALARLDVEGRGGGRAQPVAHGGGADIEGRHDREQVAADIGGDVVRPELALDQFHGGKDRPLRTAGAEARRPRRHDLGQRARMLLLQRRRRVGGADAGASTSGSTARTKAPIASPITAAVYSPAIGNRSLPDSRPWIAGLAQDLAERLLDIVGLPLLDQQHRALVAAEVGDFVRHQRIGDVQDIERDAAGAPDVGQAQPLQRAQHAVVHAALQDDADRRRYRPARSSFSPRSLMNFTAAGQRFSIFSFS